MLPLFPIQFSNQNSPNTTKLQRTNVLYKYECNVGDCEPQAYIGYTRTTLSRRITMHLQSGAPLKHSQDFHSSTLNREQMVSNTSIIRQENDFNRLEIMEALYIKYTKPEINLQTTGMGRTLRLLVDKDLCHTTNCPTLTFGIQHWPWQHLTALLSLMNLTYNSSLSAHNCSLRWLY